MLPSVGREHYRLSVTDGCRGRGDDGTSIRFRVPESVINIAHIPKEFRGYGVAPPINLTSSKRAREVSAISMGQLGCRMSSRKSCWHTRTRQP
jgi:hypothetical protein